jgi:ribosome-associated protein
VYHGIGAPTSIRKTSTIALPAVNTVTTPAWLVAARAAESKKATDIKVLDLREVTTFADYFIVCTGSNPKQIEAITEEIGLQLREQDEYAVSVEGFGTEWVLADYGDFVVHVFSPKARTYYDLERLWRHAKVVPVPGEA